MKLHSMEVDGFGALSELTLVDLDPGLNVIYGSNGSGKTTLLQFVRGILCGFDEPRRIGLLPPSDGRVGGGCLRVRWDGDVCRLARSDEPGVADTLRVALVRNDLETPHPRFEASELRTDLVPLLFAVSGTQAHALEGLIRQAGQDGIQLEGRPHDPEPLKRAAAHIHDERFALLHGRNSGLIADLTQRRRQLQADVHRLTEQLRQRGRQWEATRTRRPQGDILHWHHKVTCLRNDLAAAECDLREAEDHRWMPQPPPRTVTIDGTPAASQARSTSLSHPHLDRQRIHRLQQLDRQIEHARTLLAEAARAQLDIGLRFARIAGSDDTAPAPFLKQVRDSLKSLEIGVLELRDESRQLSAQQAADRCVCDQWQTTTQEAVCELSRRLYQLCEQVSRYELRQQKSVLARAEQTIRDAELQLLRHLEDLRARRRELLETTGAPLTWKGTAQTTVEQQICECLDHAPRSDWRLAKRSTPPAPQRIVRTIHHAIERPTLEQLAQLRHSVDDLRGRLAQAVAGWRQARNWQPQLTLPDDIHALEQQLDNARMALNLAEVRLADSQQRWRVLSVTAEAIRKTLESLDREHQPTVIQWASSYLRQLTGGQHTGIVVGEGGSVSVISADGALHSGEALSRGTRDQLALSLRLALVRTYKARGVSLPLILDDVLVDTDQQRLEAAVSLLREFAREHAQQIIYLTCQTHLAQLFANRQVMLRTLPGSSDPALQRATSETASFESLRGWVDHGQGAEIRSATTTRNEPPAAAGPKRHPSPSPRNVRLLKPLQRRQAEGPYWLSMDAPVSLVPSIGSQMGRRLVGLGVRSTVDLIDLDRHAISLRLASLQITPKRLRQWQSEAVLLCCVPDLTGPDAQLLAVAGITSCQQLADTSVDNVLTAIEAVNGECRGEARPSREIIQRWIHSARRARRLGDARRLSRRRGRLRERTRTSTARRGRRGRARSLSAHASEPAGQRRQPLAGRRPAQAGSASESAGDSTHSQSREHEPLVRSIVSLAAPADRPDDPQRWRFYLSLESPVVDAPSIGPTTANRLSRIGVITIADLLNRPAAEIALRLKNRRIKEDTVLLWQQQSRLMCRIPQLRGHDAQVLVACDVTEPEQVASLSPEALFDLVGPFVETVEGQRLLRSSRTPDLAEVTDWIHWARHSRTLRAA